MTLARPAALAIFMTLAACGNPGTDEIDAESAAILARAPIGTAFKELPAAMAALGFSCSSVRRQYADAKGVERETEPHLVCERERSEWLICTRRTRAILIPQNGRLSNVLVNVGRFCS